MLKKLVKYGNSTSLVIDKAILEILGMDDSSMVKLQTDGKSLIITPVKGDPKAAKLSYGVDEAMDLARMASYESFQNQHCNISKDQKQLIEKGTADITAKYAKEIESFLKIRVTPDFRSEIANITEKYDPVSQAKEYGLEFNKIKYRFCPALEKMDQEIAQLEEKHLPKK